MSRLEKLSPRAIAEARTEARMQRRAAELEAAQQARAEAELAARHQQVAEMVNRPFLAAVERWTAPSTLEQQPVLVREQLQNIAESVRALLRAAGSQAVHSGERQWSDALPGTLEQLLQCADTARSQAPELAFEITTVLLAAKPASRAAWRQRALAAEHAGDLPEAIHAHQSYLNLTQGDRLGVMDRLRQLQERDDRRLRLAAALNRAKKTLPESVDEVLEQLTGPTPRRRLDQAVSDLVKVLAALPADQLRQPVTQDVLFQAGRWHRAVTWAPPPLEEEVARELTVLRLNDLRQRLSGSRLCLVTDDAARLRGARLGLRVDEYDVVVRFGPTRVAAADGGSRTDLQVIRHDATDGWKTQAWMRLVLADEPEEWVAAVRARLVPGRQHAIAEKVLRRPLEHPVQDDAGPGSRPTDRPADAYQVIRLLDLLSGCQVDLVGFRPEEDFSAEERAWLAPRLEPLDEHAIGVR